MDKSELLLETQRFRVLRRWQIDSDGTHRSREFVDHPGAVVILPVLDENHLCLIRNRREAVGKTLVELPAGTRESGESPMETAHRELREEINYQAGTIEPLTEFYMSPGILNERMFLYVARDLSPASGQRDPGEQIEPFVVTFAQATSMIQDGRIQDAKSIAGILFYDRFCGSLRERQ